MSYLNIAFDRYASIGTVMHYVLGISSGNKLINILVNPHTNTVNLLNRVFLLKLKFFDCLDKFLSLKFYFKTRYEINFHFGQNIRLHLLYDLSWLFQSFSKL